MNVLIVDDDISTVEAIRVAIDWEGLGVTGVFSAYGADKAREELGSGTVDVVLCDIEMPMESGISLLSWAREKKLECEFIFLTCHERFDFASEALRLGAVSYLLKPFDPARTTEALLQAVGRVAAERKRDEMDRYGQLWLSNRETVENEFWKYALRAQKNLTEEEIADRAEKSGVLLPQGQRVTLALVSALYTSLSEEASDESSRGVSEYRTRAACAAAMLEPGAHTRAVSWRRGECLFVLCALAADAAAEPLCRKALAACQRLGACGAAAWVARDVALSEAPRICARMEEMNNENALRARSVRSWPPLEPEGPEAPGPKLPELLPLFAAGNKTRLLNRVREYVTAQSAVTPHTTDLLRSVRQNVLQEAYVFLYQNGVQPDLLFRDEMAERLSADASLSLFDMMKWLSFFVGRVLDGVAQARHTVTGVERARQFIQTHYGENITRREVAESVFLTPEYMARVFKRTTGESVGETIARCRVERAKELLSAGEVSIGDIGAMCGFSSPSYFVTVFRKATGMSPSQWRVSRGEKTQN